MLQMKCMTTVNILQLNHRTHLIMSECTLSSDTTTLTPNQIKSLYFNKKQCSLDIVRPVEYLKTHSKCTLLNFTYTAGRDFNSCRWRKPNSRLFILKAFPDIKLGSRYSLPKESQIITTRAKKSVK
ncbi:hypothetical protein CAAN1_21S01926 [[Candida] anglica]|uniref:Uncharacterized protein n=1 Tax=[Candida] anglica TaxID=148631 RepID=A0ABP0EHJ3_9ASCO